MGHSTDPTLTRKKSAQAKKALPPRHVVIMHNDDYTTMEFVVMVLEDIFHKNNSEATGIMLKIHTEGKAVCGTYPFEIAETKVETVHRMAKQAGYVTLQPTNKESRQIDFQQRSSGNLLSSGSGSTETSTRVSDHRASAVCDAFQ
jgi:ATP-dependent Clp protease adaptor protein ClpS